VELDPEDDKEKDEKEEAAQSFSGLSSVTSMLPKMTVPGDSLQLRASLVLIIFLVAVAVPNVQSLISLAGALAGSSIALLIPPFLELAWIRQMEHNPAMGVDSHFWMLAPATSSLGRFWIERCKCYFLLAVGIVFLLLGTYFSVADIVRIYLGIS
jgi:proton-coupled amino acid transporter